MYTRAFLGAIAALVATIVTTPLVILLANKWNVTDKPNERKVHTKVMPLMGGLAIFFGMIAGFYAAGLYREPLTTIAVGAFLILIIGIVDDKYDLPARLKFSGQMVVAFLIVMSGLTMKISHIDIPVMGRIEFAGWWSVLVTVLWIVGITNSINLIDGLDGLSSGISIIGISTIAILAAIEGKSLIFTLSLIIIGATLGFLVYNFYPAKIFMGDTGALLLGYSIAILTLLGLYKSVALFSIIVPVIILGVPFFDTTAAILRRLVNKRPISSADKSHLHHRLIDLGLSQRKTVMLIYGFGIFFSIAAILLSKSTMWGTIAIVFVILIAIEVFTELSGIVHVNYKPLLNLYRRIRAKVNPRKQKKKHL